MQKFTFHREATGLFSEQQNRMVYRQEELMDFLHLPYRIESFKRQIELKSAHYSHKQRTILNNILDQQYKGIQKENKVLLNLEKLKEVSTFTVTTGHQLSLFTGPLFFIYKILHAIRLSEELNDFYSDFHFVPVYWMASEDHDLEEIRSVELFGKTLSWETDQKGPVGRMKLDGFDDLKKEFSGFFSGEQLEEIEDLMRNYEGSNLAEATFQLVHRLFGQYGLIILNADNFQLKESFIPVMHNEVETEFSHKAVSKTNNQLEREGLKIQVHAREINLFFMKDQLRERILNIDEGYFIEGVGKLTKEELLQKINTNPDHFSPNVVLRPLYQEWILPNLCYIGGVGEIAYWLQLKGVFEGANVPYPLLSVRNSLLWIDPINSKKLAKIELSLEDLFFDTDHLKRNYVQRNAEDSVDISPIIAKFHSLKEEIIQKVVETDPNLERMALSETVKMEKQIELIGEKLFKSIKSKHDLELQTIDQIKNKLFPSNGLQERSVNLFSICNGVSYKKRIEQLHHFIDPFENDLILIRESY